MIRELALCLPVIASHAFLLPRRLAHVLSLPTPLGDSCLHLSAFVVSLFRSCTPSASFQRCLSLIHSVCLSVSVRTRMHSHCPSLPLSVSLFFSPSSSLSLFLTLFSSYPWTLLPFTFSFILLPSLSLPPPLLLHFLPALDATLLLHFVSLSLLQSFSLFSVLRSVNFNTSTIRLTQTVSWVAHC